MSNVPRIGVALFQDGHTQGRATNWACEFRKEAFSFQSSSDLPSQTLWITNVDLNELYRAGLSRNPKIAHEAYFRTRISVMVSELGIEDWPLEQQAALLAETIGTAAEMARLQLGLTQYPSYGIQQAVGQLYGMPEAAEGSAIFRVAESACQNYTSCERERRFEQAKIFSFWKPRYDWAQSLLSEPLPVSDQIQAVSAQSLPSMGRDLNQLVDWATEGRYPIFARIRIHALEETVGKLLNYGAGAQGVMTRGAEGSYEARNMREWCSLPELRLLAAVGDVEITQVAVASGGFKKPELDVFKSKPAAVSYSYGLVAENLWVGLTRRPSADGKVSRNLSTAWLQALDRMACLEVAERLNRAGLEIINYGYGRITVVCPKSLYQLVPQLARENGLLYPASLSDLPPCEVNPRHAFMVMQALLSRKDFNNIRKMNELALREMQGAFSTVNRAI